MGAAPRPGNGPRGKADACNGGALPLRLGIEWECLFGMKGSCLCDFKVLLCFLVIFLMTDMTRGVISMGLGV